MIMAPRSYFACGRGRLNNVEQKNDVVFSTEQSAKRYIKRARDRTKLAPGKQLKVNSMKQNRRECARPKPIRKRR